MRAACDGGDRRQQRAPARDLQPADSAARAAGSSTAQPMARKMSVLVFKLKYRSSPR